jgi:hypothetical protein
VDAGDPFGTAALRSRVLQAWAASPARFREDANAEEDYALGAYRGRLVVELAQNAADAALRGDGSGRLSLMLLRSTTAAAGWELVAANSGAPLDGDGVLALSTLRASAKRDEHEGAVGRYGVGFAAVLDVTDEPAVRSTSGGVRWSRAGTRAEVAAVPALVPELARRDQHVPVLRLPWPDPGAVPAGFVTAVVLPLRDAAAFARVRAALAEVDAALLLMLPALDEVIVDDGSGTPPQPMRRSDLDVREVAAAGTLDPALVADRPTEERGTRTWSVRWVFPRPDGTPAVVHAPTPTDEPLDLPALLIATFPLEPGRRHVARGRLRDLLIERAAQAYVDHVRTVARDRPVTPEPVLGLVPGPVAAGSLDAELREAIVERLRSAAILPGDLTPVDALAVDGLPDDAVAVLAAAVPGLLPATWAGRRELDRLGVRRIRLADLVDDLASLDRPVRWWQQLYDALETVRAGDLEALNGLPVPLADGRLVRGPRGVVVDAGAGQSEDLQVLGLRVAAPGISASLLTRLGAVQPDARALLAEPTVRSAVEMSLDADDPASVAEAVLGLVRDAGVGPGELDWLAALALPDDEGGWAPAGELLFPDGPLAALTVHGELGTVAEPTVRRWSVDVLAAVGVLVTFALVRDDDVPLDVDAADHDLDAQDAWVEDLLDELAEDGDAPDLPPVLPVFVAVRDLDLVAADRWPQALAVLAADPELRAAVVDPARAVLADGSVVSVEPYSAWWLRTHPVLAGRRPDELRARQTEGLAGLFDPVPDLGLDEGFLRAIGVVTSVADVARSPMVLPLLLAGVDPAGAVPDSRGTARPVPAQVGAVLGTQAAVPETFVEHDDLTVASVPVDWWVGADGTVHAATLDGLARGLAWATGQWQRRWLLAAVLDDPGRLAALLAEDAWT